MIKTSKKGIRRIAVLLTFALLITSLASIGNVNKTQAAVTSSGIIYDSYGETSKTLLNGKSANIIVDNGILDIKVDGEKYGYYDTSVVGSCVIADDDLLHIIWHTGEYYVYDLYESGRFVLAGYTSISGSKISYYAASYGDKNIVYGSSAANASFHSSIIDKKYFYMYGKVGKKLLMTREEFNRIVDGDDPEPTPTKEPNPSEEPTATPTPSSNCGCKDGGKCTCPEGQCKCDNCNCGPTASCKPTAKPTQTPSNNGGCKGNCGCGCGSNCNDTCCGGKCPCKDSGNKNNSNSNNSDNNNSGNVNINGNNNTVIINGNDNNGNSSNGNASLPNSNVVVAGKEKMNLSGKTFVAYPKEKIIVPYNAINAKGQSCKVVATSASKNLSVKVNSKNKLTITVGKKAKDAGKYKVMVKNGRLTSYITVFVYKHRVVTSGKRIKLYKKQNKLYGWLIFNSKKKKINWNGLTMKNVKSAGFIEGSWRIGVILKNGTVKSISYKDGTVRTIGKNAKCFRRNERGCIVSYVKKSNKTVKKITGK